MYWDGLVKVRVGIWDGLVRHRDCTGLHPNVCLKKKKQPTKQTTKNRSD